MNNFANVAFWSQQSILESKMVQMFRRSVKNHLIFRRELRRWRSVVKRHWTGLKKHSLVCRFKHIMSIAKNFLSDLVLNAVPSTNMFSFKKIDIFFLLFQIIAHIHCSFFNCSSATLTKKRIVNLGLG